MRSYGFLGALMLLTRLVFASDFPQPLVLDTVLFQVSAKQWVATKAAVLQVNVNMTLSNADLVKARTDILGNLNKIAEGDWHLLSFERSQDSSGLEKLTVLAQARIDQALLTDVYKHAKSVSVPGAQYEVGDIQFKPSLEEIQAIRAQVREQLYQKVAEELARINKAYPGQNYSVNHLIFTEGDNAGPLRAMQGKEVNMMALAAAPAPVELAVSNEMVMSAFVEAGSNRNKGN